MENISTYRLKGGDLEMIVTNFGARVMKLYQPDRDGNIADVVIGYNTIEEYLDNCGERFLGAVCGRFANRIAKGAFTVDGVTYSLPINNNGQTLHGGLKGVDSVVWTVVEHDDHRILFRYISPDGEEGFPGALSIDMSYELTPDNEFRIEYSATTDKATPVNITHHSFFNLRGESGGTINDHVMQIFADRFVPIDEVSIPTGELKPVDGTPFDFRTPMVIGSRLGDDDQQLRMGNGYDHCYVVADGVGECKLVARVVEPESGRTMEVYTDQPGMQFYGGNFFSGDARTKDGAAFYVPNCSFALETQFFPDTPNQPHFPSCILRPEETYRHQCIYKFSAE